MRRALIVGVMMGLVACEFDETCLPSDKVCHPPDGGAQEQAPATQQAVNTTGLPPAMPPGAVLCNPQSILATATSKHGRVWVWANGGEWCIQLPLGNYGNISAWGWDNRVTMARPGGCSDILLGEHAHWGGNGAVNHIWDDRWTTQLDSWWRVSVSSIAVRPLLVNPWGQVCN